MSFCCEECKKAQPTGQKMNKVVTQRRDKTYEITKKDNRDRITTEIAKGWETVTEKNVCPDCYKKITGEKAFAPVLEKKEPDKFVRPRFQEKRDTFRPDRSRQVRKTPIVETINRIKK
jgi:hypothetical protein